MGVDLDIQLYIIAGVLGSVSVLLIFFLAAAFGNITKLKRQHRELNERFETVTAQNRDLLASNYAYNSRMIQPDEELNRRGYSMHEASTVIDQYELMNRVLKRRNKNENSTTSNPNRNSSAGNEKVITSSPGDGTRDASNDFAVMNAETIVLSGNDREMKIVESAYGAEQFMVPPPPSFANHFDQLHQTEPSGDSKNVENTAATRT